MAARKTELLFFARDQTTTLGLTLSLAICRICIDIHRMTALLKLRSPPSTECGNAKPSTSGSRARQPVTLARCAPDAADFVGIKTPRPSPIFPAAQQIGASFGECRALVAELVREGPDPAKDGVVPWRRMDLARMIRAPCSVTLAGRGQSVIPKCRCDGIFQDQSIL